MKDVLEQYDLAMPETPAPEATVTPFGNLVETPKLAAKYNHQLYANHRGSDAELDYEANPDALSGSLTPNLAVLHEQPLHRAVIMLKAAGLSNNEIAQRTGYTYPWVSQLLRQPWARTRLIQELNNAGREGINNLLKGTVVDSIMKLVEIRDTAAKPSDQATAARELLNRALGMPTQHIDAVTTQGPTPDQLDEVEKELAALRAEEKRLTGN